MGCVGTLKNFDCGSAITPKVHLVSVFEIKELVLSCCEQGILTQLKDYAI